ncbi:MAG TPA: hypothetical protein VN493_17040 [Thermoanaerobaculia bacterium]|nr:hypothetical protein [Thermoanaerobaculia bacterium]
MNDAVKAASIAAVVALVTSLISAGVTISVKSAELDSATKQATEGQRVAEDLLKSVREAEERLAKQAVPVGSVVASMLDYNEFREIAGSGWFPADGRTVSTSSKYAVITGRTALPDLRGMFLRGLNEFETGKRRVDGSEDPDLRKVGDYQQDNFRAHNHSYDLHWVGGNGSGIQSGGSYPRQSDSRQTSSSGDKETRPRNVALFYYVKVN